MRERLHFLLLNIGHFLDHLFTLIFATVAALALYARVGAGLRRPAEIRDARLLRLRRVRATRRLARRQMEPRGHDGRVLRRHRRLPRSRPALRSTPLQLGIGLFVVGMFAAIYHPVGLAIVVEKWKNTGMRIAVNGVWGNLGVASAALITGYFIDNGGWRMAFIVPGVHLDPGRRRLRGPACGARSSAEREAHGDSRPARGAAGRRQGAAVARVDDRLPDDGGVEHRLPVDDLRAAEDIRRAAAGRQSTRCRPTALSAALAFLVFAMASMAPARRRPLPRPVWARAPCSSPRPRCRSCSSR